MKTKIILLSFVIIVLFCLNLFMGSVSIPLADTIDILLGKDTTNASYAFIILDNRSPQALTALLCGAALSVSGLLLQTLFQNPLAGPSLLGINSGANLGVAIVMLATGGVISISSTNISGLAAIICAAMVGSMLVMILLLFLSSFLRSNLSLLITGIMIGYLTSSAISLLNYFSTSEGVHNYVLWGMGNFSGVSMDNMPYFSILCIIGIICAVLMIKPLNALLLGVYYAENLGFNIRRTRIILLLITGLLTAVTTAFCGPIAFIGLAVPHIARLILRGNNHTRLLPLTILCGGVIALLCNLICTFPSSGTIIPLNAVTPLFGAPVIIYLCFSAYGRSSW